MSIKSFPVIDLVATGKNIVRLRKESGLSVADLQEYFGFEAPQAIYKWQKGQSLPSTDNLLALGHLLDVTMEEILVTRPTIIDIMPQEESCGSHRFGDVFAVIFAFNHQFNDIYHLRRYDTDARKIRHRLESIAIV